MPAACKQQHDAKGQCLTLTGGDRDAGLFHAREGESCRDFIHSAAKLCSFGQVRSCSQSPMIGFPSAANRRS